MKISIFTPTHKPENLARAAKSISAQDVDHSMIEWLVVCNGGATRGRVKATLPETPFKTRVIQAPECLSGVGALKRWACNSAGDDTDILVELDHDDELLGDCLKRVVAAVEAGAGFVSTATLEIRTDGSDVKYNEAHGWKHGAVEFRGKERVFNLPFEVDARSLCEIYYAPNHVRAWQTQAYWNAGGHNASLEVADDHDLMIRTYLSGAHFHTIHDPLYLQHLHDANTQKERNAEIQKNVAILRDRNTRKLVDEWCRRTRLRKLDFGGAHGCPIGWESVDKHHADITLDVCDGLPFADNSIGAIRAHDFLEHIPIGRVVPLINEIYRVLVPGGWLLTSTPSTDGRGAFCDPTHVSFWNELSWRYYCEAQYAKYVPEIKAQFQKARCFTHFPNEWHEKQNISYVVADLVALKGQRCPGWNGFYCPPAQN